MGILRRRFGNVSTNDNAASSPASTPEGKPKLSSKPSKHGDHSHGGYKGKASEEVEAEVEESSEDNVPSSHVAADSPQVPLPKRRSKRRNGLIFGLGGIFGIFVALFFANQNEVISWDVLADLNLDSLIDVIPAGIIKDATEFSVRCYLFLSILCGNYWMDASFTVKMLRADGSLRTSLYRNKNVTPLATMPFRSAYISRRKGSRQHTPSS